MGLFETKNAMIFWLGVTVAGLIVVYGAALQNFFGNF